MKCRIFLLKFEELWEWIWVFKLIDFGDASYTQRDIRKLAGTCVCYDVFSLEICSVGLFFGVILCCTWK